ncbi:MAG: NAD-dependent epimerase/dehydratase family protein [Nitrospiraceae bacterium]|nr:NAD-dependent epimerase/dehydratase family protein [Nitrospiraceae bacterium]
MALETLISDKAGTSNGSGISEEVRKKVSEVMKFYEDIPKKGAILITGALGQVGVDLFYGLSKKYPDKNIILSDIFDSYDINNLISKAVDSKIGDSAELSKSSVNDGLNKNSQRFFYEKIDVRNYDELEKVVKKYNVGSIYHLGGILSANGEKNPSLARDVNINGLMNVLSLAEKYYTRVFYPSSIAVFGPTTPKDNVPQHTILEPTTVYGATKVFGELMGQWYFLNKAVDFRSLRYNGLISWKANAVNGTTDYAVQAFREALKNGFYEFFVKEDTVLPMTYMDDAIDATIKLMMAKPENLSVRTSYNMPSVSFSAKELAESIKKYVRGFRADYKPDFRQNIADSWPKSVNGDTLMNDLNWHPKYDTIDKISGEMIKQLKEHKNLIYQ